MELLVIAVAIGLFLAILAYNALSWGFVLFKFWYWFLLPVFTTLPQIEYYHAVGLFLVLSILRRGDTTKSMKKEFIDSDQSLTTSVVAFLAPWIMLVFGFILKLILF